ARAGEARASRPRDRAWAPGVTRGSVAGPPVAGAGPGLSLSYRPATAGQERGAEEDDSSRPYLHGSHLVRLKEANLWKEQGDAPPSEGRGDRLTFQKRCRRECSSHGRRQRLTANATNEHFQLTKCFDDNPPCMRVCVNGGSPH